MLALPVLATSGCGSGSGTGQIAATDDDAGRPNQRGPLDGGADDDATADAADSGDADAPAADGGGGEVGPPDADGAPDAGLDGGTDTKPRLCTAPAKRCDGKTPQTCDADGNWQASGAACQFACSAGDCTGECLPGGFQCSGSNRQLCTATGQWMDYLACPFVCLAGECAGTCFPGRTQCLAGELQTCSILGAWQTTGTSSHELLTNAGFDNGETAWANPGIPIVYAASGNGNGNGKGNGNGNGRPEIAAQSPTNVAWFGGLNREDDQLGQTITIPADASSVVLSFYYTIFTNEDGNGESDVLDVSALAGANDVIPLVHLSDQNAVDTWTQLTTAIPLSLAGQSVTIQFRSMTNATQLTSFYVDSVSVQAVACP